MLLWRWNMNVVLLFKQDSHTIGIYNSSTELITLPKLYFDDFVNDYHIKQLIKLIYNVEVQFMLRAFELEEQNIIVYIIVASDLSEIVFPMEIDSLHYLPMTNLTKLDNVTEIDKEIMRVAIGLFNDTYISEYE